MELLNKHINLVVFHDVIGDKMINYIKQSSIGRMDQAGTLAANNPELKTLLSDYRTGSVHFLWEDETLNNLDKKIGRMTGLNVMNGPDSLLGAGASERLQVASSAFGGHYQPHLDSVSSPKHYTTRYCADI